jgi:3-oxoacyl-[acyl-carrier protein] reductase
MDLGISGRKAIVCASSQGLGLACALALAREGVELIINGRNADKLERARAGILASTPTAKIQCVTADITAPDGRSALIAANPQADILVTNNAGPPPGKLEDWDHDAWIAAFEGNMIAPFLLIRSLLPGMRARRFGRIVNITSAMVKSPHPVMGLSTAARTGLTAACKSISLEAVADNVTINNLLPERIDTPRQEFMAQRLMKEQSITHEAARRQIAASVAAKRFGRPDEFGDACAYLCSMQAGFISGQNLQLDGGSYHGLI